MHDDDRGLSLLVCIVFLRSDLMLRPAMDGRACWWWAAAAAAALATSRSSSPVGLVALLIRDPLMRQLSGSSWRFMWAK